MSQVSPRQSKINPKVQICRKRQSPEVMCWGSGNYRQVQDSAIIFSYSLYSMPPLRSIMRTLMGL